MVFFVTLYNRYTLKLLTISIRVEPFSTMLALDGFCFDVFCAKGAGREVECR